MTKLSWPLVGEILQIVGACFLMGALIEGFGHWSFESLALIGVVAFAVGYLLRRPASLG